MSNNLANLYQDLILDHSRNPHNVGEMACPPAVQCVGANPLCGDKLVVYVLFDEDRIENIRFKGEGCSIFMSACSLLSSFLKGKTVDEAKTSLEHFLTLITLDPNEKSLNDSIMQQLGKLSVFSHIQNYPARVKCAALFARTVQSILNGTHEGNIATSE